MITLQKLEIYEKFEGDVDGLQRSGTDEEQRIFDHTDWNLIEDLLRRIYLINSHLASKDFEQGTKSSIERVVQPDAISFLWRMK